MNDALIILVTLLLSAFFSGMEIAFISVNKLKIELDKGKGLFSARLLSGFLKAPSRFLGALLLGNNIALVVYGIFMARVLEPFLLYLLPAQLESEFLVLFLQTILSTLLILVAAEFIPKAVFRIYSNQALKFFAFPVALMYYLLYPLILLFIFLSEMILKYLLRVKMTEEKYEFTPVDLNHLVTELRQKEQEDEEDKQQEYQMIQNAMEFRNVKLRECMVPRPEIVAVEEQEEVEQLKERFIESGMSRLLIFRETIDNIVGYVHVFDLFRNPESVKAITKTLPFVPETMLARKAMDMFIRNHQNVAVVLDEFGGTSGIVSLEDLIEEIFGEIEDEYDVGELIEMQISENHFTFSGRLEIDYLNEKYQLDLPESDEYETLAGLILHYHEDIPVLNTLIEVGAFRFKILQATNTRIVKVSLTRIES